MRLRSGMKTSGMKRFGRAVLFGACGLALGVAQTARADILQFTSSLNGAQSVAINSTALATRTGTGSGSVFLDTDTGDISLTLSFTGLIPTDITTGPAGTNPDGTPTMTGVSGNDLAGAGILLAHFHVGAPGVNGPIPIDLFTQMGPAPGVVADFGIGATSGTLTAMFNLIDLAGGVDGVLKAGVPLIGDAVGCGLNPPSPTCGFLDALISDQTYFNIHTLNNPFGEIRGQILLVAAPEPAGIALLLLGVAGLLVVRRSRRAGHTA